MTNPAWVVLFTKIAGLVTDTGGTTSHPAVLSREFGIPAVIGTSDATHRIRTGDRIRVDGSAGVVEILRAPAATPAARPGRRDRLLMPAAAPAGAIRAASSPTRSRSACSRGSSPAATRPTRGSSRRRSPASSARARRRSARRCATSRRWASSRSRRSAARASAGATRRELLEAYVVRSALEALAARLAVPRMGDADARRAGRARRGDGGRGAGRATPTGWRRPTRGSTAGSSSSPTTPTLAKVWRSLEPFSRTYITLIAPGADPRWSAELHAPILAALRARDAEAVVAALERHFAEVSANMAGGWPRPPSHDATRTGERRPCSCPRRCRPAPRGSAIDVHRRRRRASTSSTT